MSDYESPRRMSRSEAAPASGALAVALAVIAVVAGFLILRSITNSDNSVTSLDNGSGAEVVPNGSTPAAPAGDDDDTDSTGPTGTGATGTTAAPTPTQPTNTFTGATVVVVNANGTGGSAGQASGVLETNDFQTGEPANAADGEELEVSEVLYDSSNAGAQPVAETLGRVLGGLDVEAVNGDPPTDSGSFDGAGVLLMLGDDLADMTAADVQVDGGGNQAASQDTSPGTTAAPGDE